MTDSLLQFSTEYARKESEDLFREISLLYDLTPTIHSPWSKISKLPSNTRYQLPLEFYELPELQDKRDNLLSHLPIIEVMGLPDSGKSTLCNHLRNRYPDALIKDEFNDLNFKLKIPNVTLSDLLYTLEKKLAIIPSIQKQLLLQVLSCSEKVTINSPSVYTRGVNDILAFSIPLFLSTTEPDKEFDTIIHETLKAAVPQLSYVDAVILYDNGLDIASLRRVRNGQARYSRIVNNSVWPIVESGNSWWLQYVYPLLRKKYGTGLLVVDGREHYKKNNVKVYKYIEKIIKGIPIDN